MVTIGIDLGTTNMKAVALSYSGGVICEKNVPTGVNSVPTGGEMDPKRLAVDFFTLLRDILSDVRRVCDDPVSAIGLTGMAEAGCVADLNGIPRTPVFLWYDQRGAEEAEAFRPRYERELTSVSGIRMSNVATIYKLSWLKKQFPRFFEGGYRWFGVPEWAAWLLTAEHFTDRTLAVRTGAFALKTNGWSPEVLGIMGLSRDYFPQIIPVWEQKILISPETAAYLGLSENVRVVVAGHDDAAAAYGAGLSRRVWVDSTGTAEGLLALTSSLPDTLQTVPARMSIIPWYAEDYWALIAGVGTSGSLIAELHHQTGLGFSEIDDLAKEPVPFPEDSLSAELTPQRLAKVSFIPGLSPAQKVCAVYDRIISNFSQRAEKILCFTEAPESLVITGGHARLPELSRRKSEILGGIPAVTRPEPEAAAFGAAVLARLRSA